MACLTILLAFPRTALALPCDDVLYQWYTDASYTTLVGYWGRDCSGNYHMDGGYWEFGPPPYLTDYWVQSEACCDNQSCIGTEYECTGAFYDCTHAPCPPSFPSRPW